MSMSLFTDRVVKQNIEGHRKFIEKVDPSYCLVDCTRDNRKLHDLNCLFSDTWVECKTDTSNYFGRFLIEYKANVKPHYLQGIPQRKELFHLDYQNVFSQLPIAYDSLATDTVNLEEKHLLSYCFSKIDKYYLFDLREVRKQIEKSSYPWFICGGNWSSETWRSVCQIVPIGDLTPLAVTP